MNQICGPWTIKKFHEASFYIFVVVGWELVARAESSPLLMGKSGLIRNITKHRPFFAQSTTNQT